MPSNSTVLSDQRSACHQLTSQKLDWILEIEKTATFTLNRHYLEDYRTKFKAKYKALRHEKTAYANAIRILTHPDQPNAENHDVVDEIVDWKPSNKRSLGSLPSGRQPYTLEPSPTVMEVTKRDNFLAATRALGLPDTIDDVLKMLPDDSAVSIMADVRAYWQGAPP